MYAKRRMARGARVAHVVPPEMRQNPAIAHPTLPRPMHPALSRALEQINGIVLGKDGAAGLLVVVGAQSGVGTTTAAANLARPNP